MTTGFWHKQTADTPLFPDLIWSRPENRAQAGKLGIIGGNVHGFAAVGTAFAEAEKAGIGTTRVLMPDSLQKTVSKLFPAADFAPSTPSGSFGREALAACLEVGQWSDGLLLAGNFGRNSETAILLESLVTKYSGQLTITHDAVDYFITNPKPLMQRSETTLVLSFAQLQKLATAAKFSRPFTFDTDLLRLVENLHVFTTDHTLNIVVKHLDNIFVATGGQVSSTKLDQELKIWRVATAAHAATWWLQNSNNTFESLTTSINGAAGRRNAR